MPSYVLKSYSLDNTNEGSDMPYILEPVPNSDLSIVRNANLSIIAQMIENTGLPKNIPIQYPGDNERNAQPGSQVGDEKEQFLFVGRDKLSVEVSEEPDGPMVLNANSYRPDSKPIFFDEKIDAIVRPTMVSHKVTISLRYKSIDKNRAVRWRNSITAHIGMQRVIYLHKLIYNYQIPDSIVERLVEIHRLRENQGGYGEDLNKYLADHLTYRATVISDSSGKHGQLSIAETQARVQGYFDFDVEPEKGSREGDDSTWTVGFNYVYRYDKAIACAMYFPIMIHNQIIDDKYLPAPRTSNQDDFITERSLSNNAFDAFEVKRVDDVMAGMTQLSIPEGDEFIPNRVTFKSAKVYSALCSIEDINRTALMNLVELGDYEFKQGIIDFIKGEAKYLLTPYASIFNVTVYDRYEPMSPSLFQIDSNLNLSAIADLDLRRPYRVRFSVITDTKLLTDDAKKRLQENGDVFNTIVSGLIPGIIVSPGTIKHGDNGLITDIGKNPGLAKTIGDQYVPKIEIAKVNNEINVNVDNAGWHWRNVCVLFIDTSRN